MKGSAVLQNIFDMRHCDKLALLFSVPMQELRHDHFIPCHFKVVCHPVHLNAVKESLDACRGLKYMKCDLISYCFNVDTSAHNVQLLFELQL